MPTRQIAVCLGITEHTVRNHVVKMYDKLGLGSRVELTLYVLKNNLQVVDPPVLTASQSSLFA